MKFVMAKCETCPNYVFDPAAAIAYRIRGHKLEPVDLCGEAPWCGIRVMCTPCAWFFWGRMMERVPCIECDRENPVPCDLCGKCGRCCGCVVTELESRSATAELVELFRDLVDHPKGEQIGIAKVTMRAFLARHGVA